MFVLVDNSDLNEVKFYYKDKTSWQMKLVINDSSSPLLVLFDKFLKEKHINKNNLRGLGVLVGSGSFTSTRIAVTMANTLSYAWKIPVVAIKQFDPTALDNAFKITPKDQLISAVYSGEPHIGPPKDKTKLKV